MKRFHVHVAVKDLQESIRFYSSVFNASPSVEREDYAKWMMDNPRVNFAISTRGNTLGVNHLGFQVDSHEELTAMRTQLEAADAGLLEQTGTACCYARSDKYWITDPAGIAWETFHSLGAVPVFGEEAPRAESDACCIPLKQGSKTSQNSVCCVPSNTSSSSTKCCT
jgi:catechol 2,3-dioxygenase-like lactoylglutathione lyase family enzyme